MLLRGFCVFSLVCFAACKAERQAKGHPELDLRAAPSLEVAAPTTLRLVIVGDVGTRGGDGGSARVSVATEVRRVCEAAPCDATLLLGDNLYKNGIRRPDNKAEEDEELLDSFVAAYGPQPTYAVLGNHDWRFINPSRSTAMREVEWARSHPNVTLEQFYDARLGDLHLFGLDSNWLVRADVHDDDDALAWGARIAASDARWKIALGHHPYLSNGEHGNAGKFRDEGLSLWSGEGFKAFMDRFVIGHVDLYAAGHDHNLQLYDGFTPANAPRSTATLVSGAAAKCAERGERAANPETTDLQPLLEHYRFGFFVLETAEDILTLTEYSQTHPEGEPTWEAVRFHRTSDDPTWRADDAPVAGYPLANLVVTDAECQAP